MGPGAAPRADEGAAKGAAEGAPKVGAKGRAGVGIREGADTTLGAVSAEAERASVSAVVMS